MTREESRERKEQIRADYLAGMLRGDIKKKYGINSISYFIEGLKRKKTNSFKKINNDVKKQILALHKEGKNHQQIGKMFDISPRHIVTKLREWGEKEHKIKRLTNIQIAEKKATYIRKELPPRLEVLRQKYKDIANEAGTAVSIRAWDVEITVQPKKYL